MTSHVLIHRFLAGISLIAVLKIDAYTQPFGDSTIRVMQKENIVSKVFAITRSDEKVVVLLAGSPRSLWIDGKNPCLEEFCLLIGTARNNREKVLVEINRHTGEIIDAKPAPIED